jgi:hypothetical protein
MSSSIDSRSSSVSSRSPSGGRYMMDPTAGEPYNSRGRSEGVWKILTAYGFCRILDTKGRSSFGKNNNNNSPIPNACFEYTAREECYKGKPRKGRVSSSGEMYKWTIARIAQEIRLSLIDRNQEVQKELRKMDDATMVRDALSTRGLELQLGNRESYFYSFCSGRLENASQFWHCRICRQCAIRQHSWHCKGCNECQNSSKSIPCQTCYPNDILGVLEERL